MTAALLTTDPEAFAAAVGTGRRLLGLDIGTRTIGLATATADWGFATARETIARKRWADDLGALRRFVEADDIGGLVAGLPLGMDGKDTPRTQSVRATARNLARDLGLPVLLWDERWSTVAVEREMVAADLSRARRAERVDRLAAAHILEGALARLARIPPGL
ncbi:MAG: Holliday junction resolvase RuvX [Thermaurantiacus sp.]